jgi:hypothetical protein
MHHLEGEPMSRRMLFGWCGFAVVLLTGCSQKPPIRSTQEIGKIELQDIGEMYAAFAAKNGKPPANAADLKPLALGSPIAGRGLNNPNFVVLYGTPVGGSSVLAYHKDVPTLGGLVLLSDGTVKSMSIEEFQAAPKTGK